MYALYGDVNVSFLKNQKVPKMYPKMFDGRLINKMH